MNKAILLFDIGGTNMRFGISMDGKNIESERIVPTPKDYELGIGKFKEVSQEILAGMEVSEIYGGIAGSLSADKSEIYNSPHLPHWASKPFKKDLEEYFKTKVFIENDTAIVGLGEATYGAGKGYSIVVYFTVSTGVNGVKIEDGKISKNVFGYEVGHQIIDYNADITNIEHGKGELEDFISGASLEKRMNLAPLEINDPKVWSSVTDFLAIGLYNSVLHWSPEVVILGGSLMHKIPFDKLRLALSDKLSVVYPTVPTIMLSSLGEFGGIQGALVYANQHKGLT